MRPEERYDWAAIAKQAVRELTDAITSDERSSGVYLRRMDERVVAVEVGGDHRAGMGTTAEEALRDLRNFLATGFTAWGNDLSGQLDRVQEARAGADVVQRALHGRTWMVRVMEAGHRSGTGDFWTREGAAELAEQLKRTTPVRLFSDLKHPSDPRDRSGIVGYLFAPFMIDDHVLGELTFAPAAHHVHEALVALHRSGRLDGLVGLSSLTRVLAGPRLCYSRGVFGERVSEGIQPAVTAVVEAIAIDIVRRPLAGGRFLLPLTAGHALPTLRTGPVSILV